MNARRICAPQIDLPHSRAQWSAPLAGLLILAGCAGGTNDAATPAAIDAPPTPPPAGFTDEFLMGKAYDPAVSVPDTFYADPTRGLTVSFSLAHLRSGDIGASGDFELCSDDMSTAVAWSDAVSPQWPVITVLETDSYVEITRQRSDLTDWWALHRVHRCSYLERTAADPAANTGFAGLLGAAHRSAESLKFVAEYLWQFSAFSNPGSAVLTSAPSAASDGWRHTLQLVHRVPGAGSTQGCDRIELIHWHYDLSEEGRVSRSLETIRRFDARGANGSPERCNAS